MKEDTIAAPATPPGSGAIAVVRISGSRSGEIISRVFDNHRQLKHAFMVHGKIIWEGRCLDEVMAAYFAAPASYTGEDSVEIYCHGSTLGVYDILKCLTENGARMAEPGEFTRRAFLNGKMDLTQAEAVCDFISASSAAGARAAQSQLQGGLKDAIAGIQDSLGDLIAEMQAAIEYPEDELEFTLLQRAVPFLKDLQATAGKLVASYDTGKILKEGLQIAIAGKPNVGKSSLLNALLGRERAIVAGEPGTTRDTVEGSLSINGIAVNLTDTAGIRNAPDGIESQGVLRSVDAVRAAGLTLFVADSSVPLDGGDADAFVHVEGDALIVLNKSDLGCAVPASEEKRYFGGFRFLHVSARTGAGVEDLKNALFDFAVADKTAAEGVVVTNVRHRDLLLSAAAGISDALAALTAGIDMDCVTIDLQGAWADLGGITGNTVTEDIIDKIFSKFCLGK